MKKAAFAMIYVCLISVLSGCVQNNANPLDLPELSEIESVRMINADQTIHETDLDRIAEFVKQAELSDLTDKESVQDVPNQPEFIRLEFALASGDVTTLFLYQENDKWYIEQPYQRIYLANDAFVKMVTDRVQEYVE